MANAIGGTLVVGVREDQGRAAELTPVELDESSALRMQQSIGSLTAPPVDVTIHPVTTDADPNAGFYLIDVERSARAPHSVRAQRNLRYPSRSGPSTRYMEEAEVASAYRDRFAALHSQMERLETARREAIEHYGRAGRPGQDPVLLIVAVDPDTPGPMPLDDAGRQRTHDLLAGTAFPRLVDSALDASRASVRVGYRRFIVEMPRSAGRLALFHLHQDGGGVAAMNIRAAVNPETDPSPGTFRLEEERLVQETLGTLAWLFAHSAERSGSRNATVEIALDSACPVVLGAAPCVINPPRQSEPVERVPVVRVTVDLELANESTPGLVSTVAQALRGVFQSFRIIECDLLTEDGRLRHEKWDELSPDRAAAEAARFGLTLADG